MKAIRQVSISQRLLNTNWLAMSVGLGSLFMLSCSEPPAQPTLVAKPKVTAATEPSSDKPSSDGATLAPEFHQLAEHRVAKGETLFSIARKHYNDGAKWPALVAANKSKMETPADLSEGQILLIPTLDSPGVLALAPPSNEPVTLPAKHTIQPGDTLYSLAVKYYGSGREVHRIIDANSDALKDETTPLQLGQTLDMPAIEVK